MTNETMITLSTTGVVPQLRKDGEDNFSLCVDLPHCRLSFVLDKAQVHTLGLSCIQHFPDLALRHAGRSEEDAFRLRAQGISRIDDRSLQILIREIQSVDLVAFLWYMKDAELARRFFANLQTRAAEFIFEDMQSNYGNLNPDAAPQYLVAKARASTQTILDVANRLANEGQICLY